MHRFKECYYRKKKKRNFAECFFNLKSKNYKGENQYTLNGKKTNACSEKNITMIVQTYAFVPNESLPSSEKWMLGSAWTSHICNQRQCFKRFTKNRTEIIVENKKVVIAEAFSNYSIQSTLNLICYIIELPDVLYAPTVMYNFLS